jgi:hypothetical protein
MKPLRKNDLLEKDYDVVKPWNASKWLRIRYNLYLKPYRGVNQIMLDQTIF